MTGLGDHEAELTETIDPLGPPVEQIALDEAPRGIEGVVKLAKRKEDVPRQRYTLAILLLAVTAAFSIGAALMGLLASPEQWDRLDALVPLLIAPFQTLLGAAIGWYFGAQRKDK